MFDGIHPVNRITGRQNMLCSCQTIAATTSTTHRNQL
jgi:hypothetical protein